MIDTLINLINTTAFPIVACIGMGWYIKYESDKNSKDIEAMRKEHNEEIAKITKSLDNNTKVMEKLYNKLMGV